MSNICEWQRRLSWRIIFVVLSFHFLFASSIFSSSFLLVQSSPLPNRHFTHPSIPSYAPTSSETVGSTRLNAEMRILIQGTKNAYTIIRAGDVVSYKLTEPSIDGKVIRLGVLSSEGDILPLATFEKDSSEFAIDPFATPIKAEQLKSEGRIGRMFSSDRQGNKYVISEYLDGDIHFPLISEYQSEDIFDLEAELIAKRVEIARLEAKLLQHKKQKFSELVTTKAVLSENAPKPIGPYSQAVLMNNQVFVSGCIGIDPSTGKLVEGGIKPQTERSLANLEAILSAANSKTDRIAKVTIYVTDLAEYSVVNKLYADFLQSAAKGKDIVLPARTTVQVSALPLGALVEIDAIASTDVQ